MTEDPTSLKLRRAGGRRTMAVIRVKVPDWLERICVWPGMVYRKRKFGYSFRRIYLGEGEWTIIEPEDYYRLKNFKWCAVGNGNKFYAVRNIVTGPGRTKPVGLHRAIMKPPPGILVDHINGNGLDNRRANLRLATRSQNAHNKQKTKSKTLSRLKGIFFDSRRGKWYARIKINGNSVHLGSFADELAAGRAYDEAAKKYHGEFACLNFPESAGSEQLRPKTRPGGNNQKG